MFYNCSLNDHKHVHCSFVLYFYRIEKRVNIFSTECIEFQSLYPSFSPCGQVYECYNLLSPSSSYMLYSIFFFIKVIAEMKLKMLIQDPRWPKKKPTTITQITNSQLQLSVPGELKIKMSTLYIYILNHFYKPNVSFCKVTNYIIQYILYIAGVLFSKERLKSGNNSVH